ncbi:PEP/pyruvate-binding domain-containing protein [Paucidesulfovibrio longus]|uniref:PEP/pyruvate-binding domain-containing protein n=1 Tax=Paucidesulfovibrio longus TaxID=889 RepID=UPI0003B5F4BE|nr:PEP/pyruvate-binding domain-containing protein [Paucidesulfovibrio longus]
MSLSTHIHSLLRRWRGGDKPSFADLFSRFREILKLNNAVLTAVASMNSKLGGSYIFDRQYIRSASSELENLVGKLIYAMDGLAPGKYLGLNKSFRAICGNIEAEIAGRTVIPETPMVLRYSQIKPSDREAVGAKTAHLAELGNTLGLRTPQGMVATVTAYQAFLDHNRLREPIAALTSDWQDGKMDAHSASERIQELILAGELPPRLRRALSRGAEALRLDPDDPETFYAVRSSAWGEDGEHSFAGQYRSVLGVTPDKLHDAYREVLAGAYSARVMEYRRDMGFAAHEVFMAVSFQAMIPARSSGVVYSLPPEAPEERNVVVAGTWGLGAPLVSGDAAADRFVVSRERPHKQVAISVVRKENAERVAPDGGVHSEAVPEELQTRASLTAGEVTLLAETALRLERHFKKPQDIEFAFDEYGDLYLLQARPLRVQSSGEALCRDLSESLKDYPVLLTGRGDVAQQGIATGPVFLMRKGVKLEDFPAGAILVAPHSSPSFAAVLRRAAGVITDVGSAVGHMATIAREYRVPALLNAGNATRLLRNGQRITLDAEQKTVYQGMVEELCMLELTSDRIEDAYEYRLLRRVLRLVEPLNLIDPSASNFSPEGCRTLHDITRFIHEKAVEELININHARHVDDASASGRLVLPVPLDLVLMDIGGGLVEPQSDEARGRRWRRREITPADVVSSPMHAFIQGVTEPGVWQSGPVPVDFGSFMSSLTRTMPAELVNPKHMGQNLAVISDSYAHLSLRLGYHFSMIDCYASRFKEDNYLYFRFAGGVTGATRRSRRARFIADILSRHDFSTTLQEDLVVARMKKLDAPLILRRVRILGLLVAYTRQLDVSMIDDEQIQAHVELFEKIVKSGA